MTELELREKFVNTAKRYLGNKESDGSFKPIIDIYNSISPLPSGYRMSYSDPWCAGFVSAIGKICNINHIVFPECSCDRMIALYQAAGRWEERDSYRPQIGDIIMYDWDDNGVGDNTGSADHTGIITFAGTSQMTVVEGNKSDSVDYRYISYDAKYIRGYCCPDFGATNSNVGSPAAPSGGAVVDTGVAPAATSGVRIIKKNMVGEDVKEMQEMLIAVGCDVGLYGADGEFGKDTELALIKFQRQKGLEADGEYGPLSKAALEKAYKAIASSVKDKERSGLNMTSKDTDEIVYDFLMSKIDNHIGVCAIMGNIYAESAMMPNNLQNGFENAVGYDDDGYTKAVDDRTYSNFVGDSAGYGLCQWTFWSRKKALLEYARSKKVSIADPLMQAEFLYKELCGEYTQVLTSMKEATNIKDATRIFMCKFENPADKGEDQLDKRLKYSRSYYDKFEGRKYVLSSDIVIKDDNNTQQTNKFSPSVGDVCMFNGTVQYSSANAISGYKCKPGLAKVTIVSLSKKHPYHLIRVSGGGSTVYGWVDSDSISEAS